MTEVAFHTGIADPTGYACRLLRKAYRAGSRVAVHGPAALLDRLDQALWTFEPLEFVPHASLPRDSRADDLVARSLVVLVHPGAVDSGCPVAVSIGGSWSGAAADYARIIEIVGEDPAEREAGRRRWREYEQAGLRPVHVAVPAAGSAGA